MARRAGAGAIAAVIAFGFDWGVHRAITEVPFAPFALADRTVRVTPGPVATYMIDHLHHAAQPLLVGALIVVLIVAGAMLAALVGRVPLGVAAGGFGALLLSAGVLEPVQRSIWGSVLGAALAAWSYAISLAAARVLAVGRRSQAPAAVDLDRRKALTRFAGILLAGGGLNVVGLAIGGEARDRLLELATPPRPRRAAWPSIPGLTPEVTSVADHYVVAIDITPPMIDAGNWRLAVDGLVRRPLALGYDELQRRFELVSEYAVLTCISNPVGGPLAGNSIWEGVRLGDLLGVAGAHPDAWGLAVSCADGYTAGIPLAEALHPGSLVAIAQDGQPLSSDHGFPCRLRIPALYGMLNPKWVTDIRVVGTPFTGYWVQRGWSRTAAVRTECRIDTPNRARAGEPTWIAGVAWAGVRGISRVEVSADAGRSWRSVELRQPLSPWAWTQWAYRWIPPAPGSYELVARAADGHGQPQSAQTLPPHPSGASGYPTKVVQVV